LCWEYWLAMPLEVEQKFPVDGFRAIEDALAELGSAIGELRHEADVYYAHPARDFARTDEALRIRRRGEAAYITYKGPKLDAATKTRREIELPLEGDPGGKAWHELLEALGFRPVAEVRKQRRKAYVDWADRRIEVSLDDVQEVGTFVELELMAEPDQVEPAKAAIAALAARLGLAASERRSYLELLLARM
jgi:adenylate cyclase, class 2